MNLYTIRPGTTRVISTALFLSSISALADTTFQTSPPQVGPVILQINEVSATFGSSIASAGDVNGDGYDDVLVGASMFTGNYTNEGAAYLFLGSSAGLSTSPAWRITGNQSTATLGHSVAGAGDINGDGYDDILVSAPLYDIAGQTNAGMVYIFTGSPSGLSPTPASQLTLNKANTRFGASIAGNADVNGDGYSDIIIGAYVDDGKTGNDGVYIYHGSAAGVSPTPTTTLQFSQTDAYFGNVVATAGDINNDGYDDILAGLPYYDGDKANEGAVILYSGGPAGIQQTPLQQFEGNQTGSLFGNSLSTAGDVNSDGYDDIIIGGQGYSLNANQDGAAWIYHGGNGGMHLALVLESNQTGALFGFSVSGAGDVNHDGFSDIIIGAPKYTHGEENEGAALLYLGGPSGIAGVAARTHESNSLLAEYGSRVAAPGDNNGDGYDDYLVSAFKYTQGQYQEGGVFFYPGGTGALPIHVQEFTGLADGCNAVLYWKAAIEDDLAHYTVEASTDGTLFTPISNIPRNTTGRYTYTTPQQESRTYYRLISTEINGQLTYSQLILVQTECAKYSQDMSINLYPNPATSTIQISGLVQTEAYKVTLYDHRQRAVLHQTVQSSSSAELDVSIFPAGIYTAHIKQQSNYAVLKLIISH